MMDKINLNDFAEGAVAEKFNQEFSKILENIQDPNTDHKIKRKLTIELTFDTDESRDLSIITVVTKSKLADRLGVATKVIIDRDGQGNIVASELKKQIKGQEHMRVEDNKLLTFVNEEE